MFQYFGHEEGRTRWRSACGRSRQWSRTKALHLIRLGFVHGIAVNVEDLVENIQSEEYQYRCRANPRFTGEETEPRPGNGRATFSGVLTCHSVIY